MNPLDELVISVAVAYGYAVVMLPALRIRASSGAVTSACAAIGPLCCPLLISADQVILRALAAVACTELPFKMLDYSRRWRQSSADVTIAAYFRFLIPFPVMLIVMSQRRRHSTWNGIQPQEVLRAGFGAACFASGFQLVHLVARLPLARSCFALDHAIKLVIFLITIEGLSQMLYGLERLAGYDTTPLVRWAFLSRTVAEFWYRYNTRVHTWLEHNVFRPSGGRHAPVRGILLTFVVRAVHHEVMFAIATSRLDGYQFTFFMSQALPVILSRRLERYARRSGLLGDFLVRGSSIGWFYFTSMFFFHGVNRVFPFYYASEPWLP